MALSRSKAQSLGVAFSIEDERNPADPDQPIFQAQITRNDRTLNFTGKSEDQVLQEIENYLRRSGELGPVNDEAVDQPAPATQSVDTLNSDVHDERNENDEPVA